MVLPYSYARTMGILNGAGMDRRCFHVPLRHLPRGALTVGLIYVVFREQLETLRAVVLRLIASGGIAYLRMCFRSEKNVRS